MVILLAVIFALTTSLPVDLLQMMGGADGRCGSMPSQIPTAQSAFRQCQPIMRHCYIAPFRLR